MSNSHAHSKRAAQALSLGGAFAFAQPLTQRL